MKPKNTSLPYYLLTAEDEHMYSCLSKVAQSAGVVEYTNCVSAVWQDPPILGAVYDAKKSEVKIPVMPELWGM